MFDIGWSELMLVGIVALIVIGPKELPSVLRTVGRTVTKLRRMAGEFQGQFQEALREADLADMRKEITDITDGARSSMSTLATSEMFDPLRSIRDEIRSGVENAGKPPAGDVASEGTAETPPVEPAPTETPSAEAAALPTPERPLAQVPLPEIGPMPEPSFDLPEPAPAPADEPKKSAS